MAQKGLLPNFDFESQQKFLCHDKVFWPCVATMALCGDRFWLGPIFLGHDKGFLGRDKASWLYVATWLSLRRDRVGQGKGKYVAKEQVYVVT